MKNMLYGIGLLMSGSIGIGCCIIATYQNEMSSNISIFDRILYSDMAIPFLLFCALAIIGFIVSTREYSNQNHS